MDNINSLLIFDIWGKTAHFRKYYTNSSSLSYTFPPPPTVIGILAGILGYERDSYYDKFNMKDTKIAISIKSGLKKVMQTVNYVRTKSFSEFNGSGGHTQIPTELIFPLQSRICYRIYFSHRDHQIMEELEKRTQEKRYVYPPYLGLSEFICGVEYVDYIDNENIKFIKNNDYNNIKSIINMDYLEDRGLAFRSKEGKMLQYNKERMVREFDNNRKPKEIANYTIEINGNSIFAKLKKPFYEIRYNEKTDEEIIENIIFL